MLSANTVMQGSSFEGRMGSLMSEDDGSDILETTSSLTDDIDVSNVCDIDAAEGFKPCESGSDGSAT